MFDKMRQMFDTPEWHSKSDTSDEVIDVTGEKATPIERPTISSFNGQERTLPTWSEKLGPSFYWQNYYDSSQVTYETERLFTKIADYIDGILRTDGRKLLAGSHLLSNIYSLAHSYILYNYQGRQSSEGNYWMHNIIHEIGEEKAKRVELLCKIYLKRLPAPNDETLTRYNLTPNGLPRYWWDKNGEIRSRNLVNKKYYEVLRHTPARFTVFWEVDPEINSQILQRYLKTIDYLADSLDDSEYNWSTRQRRVIANLTGKQHSWIYQEELRLPLAILKLSEQATRKEAKYAAHLNVLDAEISVQRLVPRTLREKTLEIINAPTQKMLSNVAVNNLRNSYSSAWKVDAMDLKDSSAISLFNYYRNDKRLEKFCNEVIKINSQPNFQVLALYYLNTIGPLKPAKKKLLGKYLHPENKEEFKELVEKREKASKEFIQILHNLKNPPRKVISLNSEKVEHVRKKHSETVGKLNKFLGEEEATDNLEIIMYQPEMSRESIQDIFSSNNTEVSLDLPECDLISLLLGNECTVSLNEGKRFANEKKRVLGGFIQSINQKVYPVIEDQLIVQSDDIIELDTNYQEFARNILK